MEIIYVVALIFGEFSEVEFFSEEEAINHANQLRWLYREHDAQITISRYVLQPLESLNYDNTH